MRLSFFSTLTSLAVLWASSALAQTPAPDAAAGGRGVGDYWWVILLVIIVIAAIWYFMRGRRPTL
jgi:hypothetical protein